MKPGTESQTAVLVCMGRAVAHGTVAEDRFSDPTALSLLPEAARASVESHRSGTRPRGLRANLKRVHLDRQAKMMAVRTVEIDDAIRAAGTPQLVILGAGLDGRAWRMPELSEAVVFEVDHPDSQRTKRARATQLQRTARDVRFVAVDFARNDLDAALAAAGHDPSHPTTWVWEGVVMYLTESEIEATLAIVKRRSATGSHLIVAYHSPAFVLRFVGWFVRRLGEPLRSVFTPEQLCVLLDRYGFDVKRDENAATLAATLSPDIARAMKPIRHLRIATARRKQVLATQEG